MIYGSYPQLSTQLQRVPISYFVTTKQNYIKFKLHSDIIMATQIRCDNLNLIDSIREKKKCVPR